MKDGREDANGAPPRTEKFYENLRNMENNLVWYKSKLREALDMDTDTYAALLATADKFLPFDGPIMFRSAASRELRDHAADRLLADPSVGKFFQHSLSAREFPEAYRFFQRAPARIIMVANLARRLKDTGVAVEIFKSDDRDYEKTKSSKRTLDKRENKSTTEEKTEYSPVPRKPRKQQKKEHSPAETETPTPEPADASEYPGCLHLLHQGSEPNTVQFMSLRHGCPIAMSMSSLFNTQETPHSDEIDIAAVRRSCQVIRKNHELPDLPDEWLKFLFFSTEDNVEMEVVVFDDESLREAYEIWLAVGDVYIPFGLCADDSALTGIWPYENVSN